MSISTIPIRQRDCARGTASKLISAVPLHEFLAELRADLATMARLTPNSDVVTALGAIVSNLAAAMERAADVDVFLSIEELSALTRKPESTLTRLCRDYGERIGASKVKGSWSIHWPTFEKFFRSGDEPFTEEAA